MTQTYTKETITLHCAEDDRTVEVEAMVATGTGLAYHRDVSHACLYVVTHVPSGYGVSPLSMPTEAEIVAFLERVVNLDPDRWQIDLPTLKKRYAGERSLRSQIEAAHSQTRLSSSLAADGLPPQEESFVINQYQINITLFQGTAQTARVEALNANEAVIMVLLEMGVLSLFQVRGIHIRTLD